MAEVHRGVQVRKHAYFDSVFLMRASQRLTSMSGVRWAAAMMATDGNKAGLKNMGFDSAPFDAADPDDLLLAIEAENEEVLARAYLDAEGALKAGIGTPHKTPSTLDQAVAEHPHSNLVTISVPGPYAAAVARRALELGLHVFMFSGRVPVAEEVTLKRLAVSRGLLMMGPDCGTTIIGGVGLGFANEVRRGRIGVVGAAGTGIQEVTSLIDHLGEGISHAIGTGGRDFSDEVGGLTGFLALRALERDPTTEVILVVSKRPGARTATTIRNWAAGCPKPVVLCMLGGRDARAGSSTGPTVVERLDEAALAAVSKLGVTVDRAWRDPEGVEVAARAASLRLDQGQRFVRGVFAGGTFNYEAQLVMSKLGLETWSNAPLDAQHRYDPAMPASRHVLLDMGDELFTEGRPHPMIDAAGRRERIEQEVADPLVAVLLLDFVLGHGASPDPVGDLLPAITHARERAEGLGRYLSVVAHVCGTARDPQGLSEQERRLGLAGVIVCGTSARAATVAAQIATRATTN